MSASWVEQWRDCGVFVIGDIMIDRFVYGKVERISPEAPIPVVHFQRQNQMLGGAGNVARNIVALGGRVWLAGVIGDDIEGDQAIAHAQCDRVASCFAPVPGHPTTVKTRYVSGGQQIMRLDVEHRLTLDETTADKLLASFLDVINELSAVVLSDYAKGVLAPGLVRRIIHVARDKGLPVVVDPKTREVHRYAGATVLTPNALEAEAISGCHCHDDAGAGRSAHAIKELAEVDAVIVTRGSKGMTVYHGDHGEAELTHIPTVATEVFDVSGAGDTVVAALSLALGSGADMPTAARIANVAAGLAVAKPGTATVSARELRAAVGGLKELSDPKIVDNETAREVISDWRRDGLDVGFTNGCFDLLHPGHVDLLRKARAACDRLVVALNTDSSVRRLKGESRPVQNEHARALVMSAIKSVDLVTFFDDNTPKALIEQLRPSCLIKGADYTEAQVVGAEFVKSYGGRIILVPLQVGHSTTSIIARAKVNDPGIYEETIR